MPQIRSSSMKVRTYLEDEPCFEIGAALYSERPEDHGSFVLTFGRGTQGGPSFHIDEQDACYLFRMIGNVLGANPDEVRAIVIPLEEAEYYADSELGV